MHTWNYCVIKAHNGHVHQFEYIDFTPADEITATKDRNTDSLLAELGQQHWELCSTFMQNDILHFYLKRPDPESWEVCTLYANENSRITLHYLSDEKETYHQGHYQKILADLAEEGWQVGHFGGKGNLEHYFILQRPKRM